LNFDLCVLFFPNPPVRAVARSPSEREINKVKTKRALIIFRQWSEREANQSSISVSLVKRCVFIHLRWRKRPRRTGGEALFSAACVRTFIRKITF
jgi:hypothetical protein